MNAKSLRAGDLIEVTVNKKLPFGVLVHTAADVPGMVRGLAAEIGDVLQVRVDEYDAAQHRFRGSLM